MALTHRILGPRRVGRAVFGLNDLGLSRLMADVQARPLPLLLDARTERRLRDFIGRFNADVRPEEQLDPAADEDLQIALLMCTEQGLDMDETTTEGTR